MHRRLPLLLSEAAKPYIGGQAVLEGVMMRSPKSFVVAVRRPDGSIAVREQPWNNFFTRHAFFRLPLLRGAIVLFESLWNGYVALDFSAKHAAAEEEEKGPQSGFAIGLTMVLSLAFGLGLFVGVPHLLTWGLGQIAGHPLDTTQFAFHAIDGAIRLTIFVTYIWLISRLPEIRRVFQYHGAEHKTIWAYEKGEGVEVEAAARQTTLHPRCGTSFLLLVVGISILLFSVVFPMVPRLAEGEFANTLLQMAVKLPLTFPIAGISYELQRLAARYPKNAILRVLTAPGLWMQRITTKEPSEDQLEIAVLAMRRCIAYEAGERKESREAIFPALEDALAA